MINKISSPTYSQQKIYKQYKSYSHNLENNDCFSPSFKGKNPYKFNLSEFVKGLFDSGIKEIKPMSEKTPTAFQKEIALGVKKVLEVDIPPENFENIMSNEEFRELLPTLKEENFLYTDKFNKDTLYKVDLDSQTLFSSGECSLEKKLEELEEHAKKYYEATGQKFLFAVTDKDDVYGNQHIIEIIGENPEKYQHFKFLPATKLSFTHEAPESGIGFENSELLVYGINPFSENIIEFLKRTIKSRKEMIVDFIEEIDKYYPDFAFNVIEFSEQNKLVFNRDYTQSNLYWRTREYAEGKGGSALRGGKKDIKETFNQAADIINSLGITIFGKEELYGRRSSNLNINDEDLNQTIREIFRKYSTYRDEKTGELVSTAENTYKNIIKCLSKEKTKPVIAFASPYYLSHHFEQRNHDGSYEKVIDFMKNTIDESNGMIIAFESISPIYPNDPYIKKSTIDNFNDKIRENLNLYEVGGTMYTKNIPTTW